MWLAHAQHDYYESESERKSGGFIHQIFICNRFCANGSMICLRARILGYMEQFRLVRPLGWLRLAFGHLYPVFCFSRAGMAPACPRVVSPLIGGLTRVLYRCPGLTFRPSDIIQGGVSVCVCVCVSVCLCVRRNTFRHLRWFRTRSTTSRKNCSNV